MLKLSDFLLACKIQLNLKNYKIHLATGREHPPLEAFFAGTFKEWQERQTRRNFQCDMVIGLIELSRHKWLFAGVFKILGHEELGNHIAYKTQLLPGQDNLIGRLIIEHERRGRASYLIGNPDGGAFSISEVREKKLSVEEFPGFNSVCVSFSKLQLIIDQQIQSWHGALSNIKGVYLITDTEVGKLYVGSAMGHSGIWQRWSNYVQTGHGGNTELIALLQSKPAEYCSCFQYSILEIADSHASDDYIRLRESYWKDVLRSRVHGYNSN